jgi:hypothetical protein
MPKFFEGLVDKLVVPAGARDMQAFDDELQASACANSGRVTRVTSSNST